MTEVYQKTVPGSFSGFSTKRKKKKKDKGANLKKPSSGQSWNNLNKKN